MSVVELVLSLSVLAMRERLSWVQYKPRALSIRIVGAVPAIVAADVSLASPKRSLSPAGHAMAHDGPRVSSQGVLSEDIPS
jgi:hypothetical protein